MNAASAMIDFVDDPLDADRCASFSVSSIRAARSRTEPDVVSLVDSTPDDVLCDGIVGRSRALRGVLAELEMVAPTDATVLICGETGTGKELIARAVHNLSARRANAFVKVNCAAIPAGLLESELFGHEKGAFTGAVMHRVGRFELANRGSIFLDEIGEAPLELQPKLLRVLQEREFERLGSSRTVHTDARLVAATNVNLPEMVAAKTFRVDLYYRLNVFPIHVPPLRDRREDIAPLVRHFVRVYAKRMGRRVTCIAAGTMESLLEYSWPGNIRELQNLIERAVIRSTGDRLAVSTSEIGERPGAPAMRESQATWENAQRAHIVATLKDSQWVLSGPRGAAARLGVNRSTLQFRMKKLGIERHTVSE
ncbi:MAG TPA: sigma 54-interacting transcriptional regulator [Vicinamibacterales bacterium]|nr:sigma 54-interacting transcriptional regulator [Vicinamibacterales bacterium]